jgi:hypothetical protein
VSGLYFEGQSNPLVGRAVRRSWGALHNIPIIGFPPCLPLQYLYIMCIMPSLLYLILVALPSSFVNALITFKDVDELAVVTTSCFKTIKHHDVFGSPLLMNQGRAHLSQYGNELESVSF